MYRVVSYEKFKKAEVERTLFRSHVEKECHVFVARTRRKDLVVLNKIGEIVEVQLEAA